MSKKKLASSLCAFDVVIYGVLGAFLLATAAYEVGKAAFASRSVLAIGTFVVAAAATVVAVLADVRRRKLGVVSRLLVGACVGVVIAIELSSAFP
ncbi:MAG: hypothetical protein U0230_24370 [Polyangiales bacterium]